MSRVEELESKELLTKEEFKERGHYRMSQMIHSQAACRRKRKKNTKKLAYIK